MKRLIIVIALLAAALTPCLAQGIEREEASTQGLIGGPQPLVAYLPALGSTEGIAKFQGKRPAALTAICLDTIHGAWQEVGIAVFTRVGRGRHARWQLLAQESSIFPLITFTPTKTADYLVLIDNPTLLPVVVWGRTN